MRTGRITDDRGTRHRLRLGAAVPLLEAECGSAVVVRYRSLITSGRLPWIRNRWLPIGVLYISFALPAVALLLEREFALAAAMAAAGTGSALLHYWITHTLPADLVADLRDLLLEHSRCPACAHAIDLTRPDRDFLVYCAECGGRWIIPAD